jgi:hypothetical protein
LLPESSPENSENLAISGALAWIDSIPEARIAALRAASLHDAERLQRMVQAGGNPDDFDPSL